jgi:hypothetical protein
MGKPQVTLEQFKERAYAVHGDLYGYEKVVYRNNRTHVIIECKVPGHGEFPQVPYSHLKGHGCPICANTVRKPRVIRPTTEEFIAEASEIHNGWYTYAETVYQDHDLHVTIGCPKHGPFKQTPRQHLAGSGCRRCAAHARNDTQRSTVEEFIEKARLVHGEAYDYSEVIYRHRAADVSIRCPQHGVFYKRPYAHWEGQGCPHCPKGSRSQGENKVAAWLDSLAVSYKEQWPYPLLSRSGLRADFLLNSLDVIIEYDGKQHFKPERFTGQRTEAEALQVLHDLQHRDALKNAWAAQNGYTMIRIHYKVKDIGAYLDTHLLPLLQPLADAAD